MSVEAESQTGFPQEPSFFISYRRLDKEANQVAPQLRRLLIEEWGPDTEVFLDVETMKPGQNWSPQIDEALQPPLTEHRAKVVIFLYCNKAIWLDKRASGSPPPDQTERSIDLPDDQVRRELRVALNHYKEHPKRYFILLLHLGTGLSFSKDDIEDNAELIKLNEKHYPASIPFSIDDSFRRQILGAIDGCACFETPDRFRVSICKLLANAPNEYLWDHYDDVHLFFAALATGHLDQLPTLPSSEDELDILSYIFFKVLDSPEKFYRFLYLWTQHPLSPFTKNRELRDEVWKRADQFRRLYCIEPLKSIQSNLKIRSYLRPKDSSWDGSHGFFLLVWEIWMGKQRIFHSQDTIDGASLRRFAGDFLQKCWLFSYHQLQTIFDCTGEEIFEHLPQIEFFLEEDEFFIPIEQLSTVRDHHSALGARFAICRRLLRRHDQCPVGDTPERRAWRDQYTVLKRKWSDPDQRAPKKLHKHDLGDERNCLAFVVLGDFQDLADLTSDCSPCPKGNHWLHFKANGDRLPSPPVTLICDPPLDPDESIPNPDGELAQMFSHLSLI